jgi:hypothetical protein
VLTLACAARRPTTRLLAAARGATSSPGARRVSPVRAKPWARWGAAGRVSCTHTYTCRTRTRLKAGAAQKGGRRGTVAREAHGAAGSRPWRAWVRPAGARALLHLHSTPTARRPGSQQFETRRKRARLTSGLAARHALGAAHDGAAHNDAARHGVIPQPTCKSAKNHHRNGDSSGTSRLGVALTPGCRCTAQRGASRRHPWGGGGARARTEAARRHAHRQYG